MSKIRKLFSCPWKVILTLGKKKLWRNLISDQLYLRCAYRNFVGKKLDLKNPEGFCEKIQWLKLYDRKDYYPSVVDKFEAKEYVCRKIGDEYIIPTIGVYDDFDQIDFSKFPNQFVLKCTHDSAGVVVVKDKKLFDVNAAKEKINASLKKNFFYSGREWPYKNVKPRIIAEVYMEDHNEPKSNGELIDYKFYCFNGVPKFLYVSVANFINGEKHDLLTYLNLDWTPTVFGRPDHPQMQWMVKKPEKIEEMISVAETLSADFPFMRVDLYYINGNVYFSELTFSPGSGFGVFTPESWEKEIGSWIKLPQKTKCK